MGSHKTMSLEAFANRLGWKNDPNKIHVLTEGK